MRRGAPRGRGNNRPMHRPQNQHPRQAQGGPLMTDHLQGLKDIDMELELLKRKREIIEQQQHMLSTSYRQRNDYEQPMFNQSRDNRYDDYTRLYDNPRESNSYGGGEAPNRKRAHIPVWENESPPKRFSAPSRGSASSRGSAPSRGIRKAFGSRLGPPPNNSRPDFQRSDAGRSAPYKPFKAPSGPPQKKREFNPTRVTKPSAAAPPVKLGTYPPAERKKLVNEALANSTAMHTIPTLSDDWIFRVDREPSRQMNGRLELALGSIMKELKLGNPEYEELFRQPASTRVMKRVVRERIRAAMIGKVVSTSENIKANYYDMFPSSTDIDVMMKGLDAQGGDFVIIKSDNPEVYFKKNIYRLMSSKLEEMIAKLDEIYCGAVPSAGYKKKPRHPKPKNQTQPNLDAEGPKTDDAQAKKDESVTNADTTQPKTDDGDPQTDEVQSKPDETQPEANIMGEPVEGQPQANIEDSQANIDEAAPTKVTETPLSPLSPALVNNRQYKAFDKLMTLKIVHLLKRFSPNILKIMDVDSMYRKTKNAIINETKKKLVGGGTPAEVSEEPQVPQNVAKKATPEKRFHTPLKYYVKILGKPSLPKRKAMESFFNQFQPQTVKKHRTIHNLLFVGFVDKESFDKILAANGTVIGRFTLDIKVSERADKKNQNKVDSSVVIIEDNKSVEEKLSTCSSEVIGSDLDDQITDLLSSIRKQEELDTSSDDVVMYELPANGAENDVKKENGDQPSKMESDIAIKTDASQDEMKTEATKKETSDNKTDDVVEVKKTTPEASDNKTDDVVEDKETPQNDVFDVDDRSANDDDVVEIKDVLEAEAMPDTGDDTTVPEEADNNDTVEALKPEVKAVKAPKRASERLNTPSGIKTRRMSKLTE